MMSLLTRRSSVKLAAEVCILRRASAQLQRMNISSRSSNLSLCPRSLPLKCQSVHWRDSRTFGFQAYSTQVPLDVKNAGTLHKAIDEGGSVANDPDVFGNVSQVRKFRETGSRANVVFTVKGSAKKHDCVVATEDNSVQSGSTPDSTDPADVFGLLDIDTAPGRADIDDGASAADDRDDEEPIIKRKRLYPTERGYGNAMLRLINERKLGEALALLKRMTDLDHIKPNGWIYTILINGCGRSGYTAAAFRLYIKMKERNFKITPSVYVGLFNSCANSPWPEDGLARARKLYTEIVIQKELLLNNRNYHAMIKAFGRCGDLPMALGLADQMVEKQVAVTTETFNFLLSACATDRKNGFLHAIMMWRKMREKHIRPDIYSYNLLLRTVHDCGLGDPDTAQTLLLRPFAELSKAGPFLPPIKPLADQLGSKVEISAYPNKIEGGKLSEQEVKSDFALAGQSAVPRLPDLLSPRCVVHDVVSLHKVDKAVDRLLMLGGMSGLLERMARDRVQPDLKTFTQLLETIPSTQDDESQLMVAAKYAGVVLDVDFFNVLIKKRNTRRDVDGAKGALDLIAAHGLHVDIATFGTLAISCSNIMETRNFLDSMEQAGFRPNIQIMGCLIKTACRKRDFWFLLDVMQRVKIEEIQPDPKMLTEMERCVSDTKRYMVEQEKRGKRFDSTRGLGKSFRVFLMSYKAWLKELEVQMPDHPWGAYKLSPEEDDVNQQGSDHHQAPSNFN